MLATSLACLATGTDRMPTATAKSTSFDTNTGVVALEGNAHVAYGDVGLAADQIQLNQKSKVATAKGHMVLTKGNFRLVADEGTYNLVTGALHVKGPRLGVFPIYTMDGTLDHMELIGATTFFRENTRYAPSITANKIIYEHGKILSGEGLRLGFLGAHFCHCQAISTTCRPSTFPTSPAALGFVTTSAYFPK